MTISPGLREHQIEPTRQAQTQHATETILRWSILTAVFAVLLTPFVVTMDTVYPFVVGKALWSRCAIAVMFVLWTWLAAINPAYRPPRSWVLAALFAAFAASLLATGFSVGVQRSLWSYYGDMQGVIDQAHWLAFAVVLASMFRTSRAWQTLLRLEVGIGTAMACLVLARHLGIELPFFGTLPETAATRSSGPLGSPNLLSHYMLINLVLTLGFLARWTAQATSEQKTSRHRLPIGLLWIGSAALHIAGFSLAGSIGALAGLGAGALFLAAAYVYFVRADRARWVTVALLVATSCGALGAGAQFFASERAPASEADITLLERAVNAHYRNPTFQSRLAAWEAGAEGFMARPLLGWGPHNFVAVFGQFASGYGATVKPHNNAHGKLIEVATTTGAVGLLAYLALWSAALVVMWQAAARATASDRTLALFLAAALVAGFVQNQSLVDTATISLLHTLLFAFTIHLESSAPAAAPEGAQLAPLAVRHRTAWTVLALTATAVALADLATHRNIWIAADIRLVHEGPTSIIRGIESFDPLANWYRKGLFEGTALLWTHLRSETPDDALALFEEAQTQAQDARRAEPHNWRIQHAIARMYRAVAATEPEYSDSAEQQIAHARKLAPHRAVFPSPLGQPQPLAMRSLGDGGLELSWRPSEGAGYHRLAERSDSRWRKLIDTYDSNRTSFTVPPRRERGPLRYRIRACLHPKNCTPWAEWPRTPLPATPKL